VFFKNFYLSKGPPAPPPCKTFHGYSESKLHMIVEVNYNYMNIGRAGDTLAIKIFFTLSHTKIIAEKV
jgi:hypothetical protein